MEHLVYAFATHAKRATSCYQHAKSVTTRSARKVNVNG